MIRALNLEDFAAAASTAQLRPAAQTAQDPAAPEPVDDAMAAFDEGYRNGWEDCAKAEAESNHRIGADLAANLQDLSLSYAEARADVLAALGPLFEDMAAQLLPTLAAEAVAPAVIAELRTAAEAASDGRAVLFASPGAMPALARLIEMQDGLDIELRAEPAFAEGQVSLRFGTERRDIDLSDAAQRMAEAIRAFVAQERIHARPQTAQKGVA
ncbi:flagellar biosynthesis protein [Roseicyclus sp.]|uniref:flagellar biosynthesis protein n=1 Tax=Roseicyclus sp. TaxID=1914329 RepID=UPI003F6C4BBB